MRHGPGRLGAGVTAMVVCPVVYTGMEMFPMVLENNVMHRTPKLRYGIHSRACWPYLWECSDAWDLVNAMKLGVRHQASRMCGELWICFVVHDSWNCHASGAGGVRGRRILCARCEARAGNQL